MRIMVTGRDGQVARSLVERAGAYELIHAARPEFDLADAVSIERSVAYIHPDVVISAAAYTAVDKAEDEPELAMKVNGDGPGVLAKAAARIGAPIIHLSTDYVFDGSLGRPWREGDPVAPLGVYGATKLVGEQAIASTQASYAILRTAWVYSVHGQNFVKTMLRLASERERLDVVDDQRGCPTSAVDIADAIFAVIGAWGSGAGGRSRQIYHFAGADELSWADFARAIFVQSAARGGPSAEVTSIASAAYPTRARRPLNSRLDSSKFSADFGHRPPPLPASLGAVVGRLLAAEPRS